MSNHFDSIMNGRKWSTPYTFDPLSSLENKWIFRFACFRCLERERTKKWSFSLSLSCSLSKPLVFLRSTLYREAVKLLLKVPLRMQSNANKLSPDDFEKGSPFLQFTLTSCLSGLVEKVINFDSLSPISSSTLLTSDNGLFKTKYFQVFQLDIQKISFFIFN